MWWRRRRDTPAVVWPKPQLVDARAGFGEVPDIAAGVCPPDEAPGIWTVPQKLATDRW